jgi:hypothetical protein
VEIYINQYVLTVSTETWRYCTNKRSEDQTIIEVNKTIPEVILNTKSIRCNKVYLLFHSSIDIVILIVDRNILAVKIIEEICFSISIKYKILTFIVCLNKAYIGTVGFIQVGLEWQDYNSYINKSGGYQNRQLMNKQTMFNMIHDQSSLISYR